MVLPDVAIPVGPRRDRPDPLRWVLRCLDYHLPHGRVFLAGRRLPAWVNPAEVVFLATEQAGQKHQNIGENLRAVLDSDITEDFYWFNDDIFVIADTPQVVLMHRDFSFDDWYAERADRGRGDPKAANYIGGMLGQWELLEALGRPTDVCTDAHVPMPINRADLKDTLALMPAHLEGHFRAVYGAGRPSVPILDPKIDTLDGMPDLDWPYVSTSPASWETGRVGTFIRNRYWRPSRYEL